MSSQHPEPGADRPPRRDTAATPRSSATRHPSEARGTLDAAAPSPEHTASATAHGASPGAHDDAPPATERAARSAPDAATATRPGRDATPADRPRDGDGERAASSAAQTPATTGAVQYSEKLTVSWWVWLIVVFVGAAGFVAVAPISIAVGVIVGAVLMIGVGLAVHLGAPSIVLTDEDLRVGRAYIERQYVGAAEALRGAEARTARGPGLDGRAFMNFRVSVPDLCRIRITDPVDPTPYWLTATRHPDELARAVNAGAGHRAEAPRDDRP